jgi:DNA-binding transcriptional LysR family regulator
VRCAPPIMSTPAVIVLPGVLIHPGAACKEASYYLSGDKVEVISFMSTITLRQLEVFAQAVEHGSFRRCADHIGVSQVAVSGHIRALEAGLGHALFTRDAGGRATLTDEGRRAHDRVQDILLAVDDLLWDTDRSAPTRRVTIAANSFIMRFMQSAISRLRQAHENLEIVVETETYSQTAIRERLRSRLIDVGYFFALNEGERTDSILLREEPLAIYVGNDHPLAMRRGVTAAELSQVPAVMLPKTHAFRKLIDRALAKSGWVNGEVALETDEYGLILTSVHRGLGFVCMFRAAEEDFGGAGALIRLDLAVEPPGLELRQTIRRHPHQDPLLDTVVAHLARAARSDQLE